tara:strand:- start:5984 stop:6466 length:483 start_codon:yes stop_codon:yes gene_type:complete
VNIEGVKVKELTVHQDISDVAESLSAPGFLMEVLRDDDGLLKRFGQSTFTVAYKDTIKAFHWHQRQDDLWFVASGKAFIVLHDLREGSSTYGTTETVTAGVDNYKLILIPVGVAHGYKVVSDDPVLLFYHTTESYDSVNPDEKRIAYNDPNIGFNWESLS